MSAVGSTRLPPPHGEVVRDYGFICAVSYAEAAEYIEDYYGDALCDLRLEVMEEGQLIKVGGEVGKTWSDMVYETWKENEV